MASRDPTEPQGSGTKAMVRLGQWFASAVAAGFIGVIMANHLGNIRAGQIVDAALTWSDAAGAWLIDSPFAILGLGFVGGFALRSALAPQFSKSNSNGAPVAAAAQPAVPEKEPSLDERLTALGEKMVIQSRANYTVSKTSGLSTNVIASTNSLYVTLRKQGFITPQDLVPNTRLIVAAANKRYLAEVGHMLVAGNFQEARDLAKRLCEPKGVAA